MTPKQKRDALFRYSRPIIRSLEVYDGDQYHKDMKILWVAHQTSPLYKIPENISQEDFAYYIEQKTKVLDVFVIDDENPQYKEMGPIAVGGVSDNGWKYEPHATFFPWATNKNVLRGTVSFLQMYRYSRQVGCVVIYALEEFKNLFDHVCKYGVLHYVGKIVNGDERGDEYQYSVRGKRNVAVRK